MNQNQENITIKIFNSPIAGCVGVIAKIKDYVVRDPAVDSEKVDHFVSRIVDHVAEFNVDLHPEITGDITQKIHAAIRMVREGGQEVEPTNPHVIFSTDATGLTLTVYSEGESMSIGGIVNPATLDNAIDSAVCHAEGDEPTACVTEAVKAAIREVGHTIMLMSQVSGITSKERVRIDLFPKPTLSQADVDCLEKNEKPESICEEAHRLTNGDRQESYGHPLDDFTRTAAIWAAILGAPVTAEQVALCMVGVKISRECNHPKRDNLVDGAGYFNCLSMVREERIKRK